MPSRMDGCDEREGEGEGTSNNKPWSDGIFAVILFKTEGVALTESLLWSSAWASASSDERLGDDGGIEEALVSNMVPKVDLIVEAMRELVDTAPFFALRFSCGGMDGWAV